jgi:hypothetical protein
MRVHHAGSPFSEEKMWCFMQNGDERVNDREGFEDRVRQVSGKGPLLSYSFAGYVSGYSRARLRQLVSRGTVETEKVNGQLLIVLRSLVDYRRRILKQKSARR